ncbi:hypothetical protein RRG08_044858 [Elysia crispata]|uniref:PDZ domain-containing protein n=1 Tax=Elysia crispata TaxID=231223 RepID=A0AAE1A3M8_9GAST|nr:hypothetical protein RRG08_044858 [Elysia crispata]
MDVYFDPGRCNSTMKMLLDFLWVWLPDGLLHLRNLTQLGLNDVALQRLPNDISNLTSLGSLELRDNMLKILPDSISFLIKLKILDLGSNDLETLPPSIGSLPALEELWLDCNYLTDLPPEIGNLRKLSILDLSENQLDYLPDEIDGLQSLTDLCLSQNGLEYLPDGIGHLKKLSILKADMNRLLTLTPYIGSCENMQELILTENLLSDLPNSIGKLKNLHNLNVDRNRLTEIPVEIGICKCLGVLSMRDNKLLRLPQELGNLNKLQVLDVSGNRLEYLPMTIANLNLKALWLSENQAQPMLKFQTDFDERTGQRVLTCFLLPQQGFHTESMENLLKGSIATEGSFTEKDRPRDSVIRFDVDHEKVDDAVDSDDSTHFVRHDTPHPRELKARHQKFLKDRNIDGHVIPHIDNKDGSAFVPSRDQDHYYDDEDEAPGPYYKEYDREPSPATHQMLNSTYTKSPVHDGRGEDTQAPPSPRPPAPDIIKAPELTGTPSSTTQPDSSSSEDEGLPQESQPLLTGRSVTLASTPTVRIAPNEVEEIDDSRDVEADHDDSSTSEKVQKSSDEESDDDNLQRDRKVGFAPEVDEESSKDHRLRRRDTPHYLKNKRVHKEEDAEQKVLEILAQAAKQRDGAALSPVVKPPELETMTAPAPATQQLPVEVQEEEITIHILREPRQGLGISIAGGQGSTPVKGDDESIFISRVTEDGPAGKAGIMKGDKLLKVNDSSLVGADHYEAVNVLKNSGNDITMVVAREKLVANAHAEASELVDSTHESVTTVSFSAEPETEVYGETVTVNLLRDDTGLGFSIAGGRGSVPYKGNDRAIYISKITSGGTADKSGKLQVGDRIVSINDVDLADARHDQAVNLLTGLDRSIKLVVYREKVLPKGEGSVLAPPGSQRIPSITQPVINWQASNSAAPAPARTPSPAGAQQQQLVQTSSLASGPAQPNATTNMTTVVAVSASSSPFSSAVPTSYSYLSQPTAPTLTLPDTPASQRATSSPSSPRTLSSDWTAPATTVQPPKFVYPGINRPPSSTPSAPAPSHSVAISSSLSSSPTVTAPSAAAASSSSPSYSSSSSQRTSSTLLPSQTLNLSPVTLQVSRTPTTLSATPAMGHTSPSRDELAKVSNESPDSNHVDSRTGSISPQPYPVEDIVIVKAGGPLGLSIVGGRDNSSQPFGGDEPGVFVSKIVNDGAAARTNLRIGDRILTVNNKDLRSATHQEAVMALIAPTYEIHLTVRHDPPPPGLQELTIDKDPGEKLGLSIKGGAKHLTTPDRSDEGIFISRINEDGAAARDGRLKPGQRILEVNGQSLLGSSHQEAVRALRSIGDKLTILVCDQPVAAPPSPTPAPGVTDKGSETNSPAELSSPSSQGGLLASSLPGSSSSIDREDEESRILQQEQEMLKEAEEWEREQQVLKQQKRQSIEGPSVAEHQQPLSVATNSFAHSSIGPLSPPLPSPPPPLPSTLPPDLALIPPHSHLERSVLPPPPPPPPLAEKEESTVVAVSPPVLPSQPPDVVADLPPPVSVTRPSSMKTSSRIPVGKPSPDSGLPTSPSSEVLGRGPSTSPPVSPASRIPVAVTSADYHTIPVAVTPADGSPPSKIPAPTNLSPASPTFHSSKPNSGPFTGGPSKIPVAASVTPVTADVKSTSPSSASNITPPPSLPSRIPVAAPDPVDPPSSSCLTSYPEPLPVVGKPVSSPPAHPPSRIPVLDASPSSPTTGLPSTEVQAEQLKEILQVERQQIKRPESPASVINKQVPQKPLIPDKPVSSPFGFSTTAGKSPATQPPSAIPRMTHQPPGPAPLALPSERESHAPKSPISPVAAPVSPVTGTAPTSFASPTPPKAGAPRPVTTFMSPRPYAAPALPPKPSPSLLLSKKEAPPSTTFIPKPVQFAPPKKPDISSSSPSKPVVPPFKPAGSNLPTRPVTFTPSSRPISSFSPKPAPFSPPTKSPTNEGTGPRPAPFIPPSKPVTGSGPKPAPFYPPTNLPRPVTFTPRPTPTQKPGAWPGEEMTSPVSPTSPTNIQDVRKSARMPSGIPKKKVGNENVNVTLGQLGAIFCPTTHVAKHTVPILWLTWKAPRGTIHCSSIYDSRAISLSKTFPGSVRTGTWYGSSTSGDARSWTRSKLSSFWASCSNN